MNIVFDLPFLTRCLEGKASNKRVHEAEAGCHIYWISHLCELYDQVHKVRFNWKQGTDCPLRDAWIEVADLVVFGHPVSCFSLVDYLCKCPSNDSGISLLCFFSDINILCCCPCCCKLYTSFLVPQIGFSGALGRPNETLLVRSSRIVPPCQRSSSSQSPQVRSCMTLRPPPCCFVVVIFAPLLPLTVLGGSCCHGILLAGGDKCCDC